MSPVVRRRLIVRGRVQGVFFRGATLRRAEQLGLAGFVRNLPDGAVEAVVEGPPDRVEELIDFCRAGPPAASVLEVEERAEPPEGLAGFAVR